VAPSDHNLRQMVARLPSMTTADFDAVMDSLSGAQRTAVIAMLREFDEGDVVASMRSGGIPDYQPVLVPENLSPWLAARVNGNPESGDEVVDQFTITTQAAAALRACAAEMVPQPERFSRPSLFDHVWQRILGVRRPT
jgi:hypothetical protein